MSTEAKNIRVLYLGPSGRPGVYTEDLDQQSRAAKEMGAEFVVYDGNSEGELIEALKDTDVAMSQGHGISPSIFSCLLYTSPSPRDRTRSRMPSSA